MLDTRKYIHTFEVNFYKINIFRTVYFGKLKIET